MSDASWATAMVAWMLTYLVHSTIFIGAAWGAARLLRRHPDVMGGIWKVALLGGIVTASAQLGLGVSPLGGSVSLPGTGASLEVDASPVAVKVEAGIETPTADAELVALSPLDSIENVSAGAAVHAVDDSRAAGTASWIVALAWLLMFGSAIGALSVLRAAIGLRRRLARRAPVRGELQGILHDLMRRARCARRVGLSVDARTSMPLAMGVLHPEIVLPRRVTSLDAEQQRPILAHELAHVVRRDPAWRLVALLIERVLFVQPLNRIAADRMAVCAELASDDWAARHTNEPLALARCLTEVASWLPRTDLPRAALASPMAASSQLRDRVLRLLDPQRPTPPHRGIGMLAACLVAGVAWAAPGVSTGDVLRGPVPAAEQAWLAHAIHEAAADDVDITPAVRVMWNLDTQGHTVPMATTAVEAPDAPASRRARRKAKRRVAKANRKASRELRAAMRDARREGKVALSPAEIDRIVAKAELEAGRAPVPSTRHDAGGERFELRIELPEGSLHLEVRGSPDERAARHHTRRPPPPPPGHRARPVPHPFKPGKSRARKHGRAWGQQEIARAREELRREHARGELPREVYEQVEHMLDRVERSLERAGQHDARRIDPPFGPVAPAPPAGSRSRHRRPAPPAAPPSPPEGVQWTL